MKYATPYFAIIILCLMGCSEEPGLGGNATIIGNLKLNNYNSNFSVLQQSYYPTEEFVYIVFGDNAAYGDRVRTGLDGSFEFKQLKLGSYTLYAYSKDSTFKSPSGYVPIFKTVEITSPSDILDVGELVVLDNDVDGHAAIRGKVWVDNGSNQYYAPDERVYLVYENNAYIETSQRTKYDGSFEFTELPKGNYSVYVYTDDNSQPSGIRPIIQTVDIDSINQLTILPDFVIND